MSEFTKGKWFTDGFGFVRSHDEYERSIAKLIRDDATKDIDDANERLILAAPEMYEILKFLCKDKAIPEESFEDYLLAFFKAKKLLARIDGKEAEHEPKA